jgi:hypothetical protein
MKIEFYRQIFTKYKKPNMKIRPVGAELFHDDGRTDRHMAKQVLTFGKFAKAPKDEHVSEMAG